MLVKKITRLLYEEMPAFTLKGMALLRASEIFYFQTTKARNISP
jgi:hypothetical protein